MRPTVLATFIVVASMLLLCAAPAEFALEDAPSPEHTDDWQSHPVEEAEVATPPAQADPQEETLEWSGSTHTARELDSVGAGAREDGAIVPAIERAPQREPTRAGEGMNSYILYEDFESGTDGWTLGSSGGSCWATTTDRSLSGNNSLYCAGSGGVPNQYHRILYDNASLAFMNARWDMGDHDPTNGIDCWGVTTNRSSSEETGIHSYWCCGGGDQFAQYDINMEAYMIKEVDLAVHTDCVLGFDHWLALEDNYDFAYVKVSNTTNGDLEDPEHGNWTTIATYSDGYDSGDTGDTLDSTWAFSGYLDISAWDGEEVYIMFYFYSDYMITREGWYVDYIEVWGRGTSYENYTDTYADVTLDLVGYSNACLEFSLWMDAEDGYDTFNVSIKNSTDAGWNEIVGLNYGGGSYNFDGSDPDYYARRWLMFVYPTLDIPSYYLGRNDVQLRFWFSSDDSVTREGMYIDDVIVRSVILYDEMESGINGWSTTSADPPQSPYWHQVSTDYYSESTSWWCGNDSTSKYDNNMDEYLYHSVDLNGYDYAAMTFTWTGEMESGYDYLFIAVSTDGGSNWDYLGYLTGSYMDGWYYPLYDVDLSAYAQSTVLVAFDFYSDNTWTEAGVWIDDVMVYGAIDKSPPSQVTGLNVSQMPSGTELALQWSTNPEPDVAGYKVFRSKTELGDYAQIALAPTNSYLDTDLPRDTTYYYKVRCYDLGGLDGALSDFAFNTTLDTLAPVPLGSTAASDTGLGGEVNVTWDAGPEPDIAGYKVFYSSVIFSNTDDATYHPLSPETDPDARWSVIAGLSNGVAYHFAVVAVDGSGNENKSITKTALATPTDSTSPLVSILYPNDTDTLTGVVKVQISATDRSAIATRVVSIDKGDPLPCTWDPFLLQWVYEWNTTLDDIGSHTIDAQATDEWGNSGDASQITITTYFTRTLAPGWNLVSVPLVQGDESVASVLASIDGKYDLVQWYDAGSGSWMHWNPAKVGQGFPSTLTNINHTQGLYVNMTQSALFTPTGSKPTDVGNDVWLYPGWNLVGFPASNRSRMLVSEALAGIDCQAVERFNVTSGQFEGLDLVNDYLARGEGYWIYLDAPTPVLWDVP